MTSTEATPCAVYRLRDSEGQLLYVGISSNVPQRLIAHRNDKAWGPQIASWDVVEYPSRTAAEMAERVAIGSESPLYNVASGGKAHRVQWRPGPRQGIPVRWSIEQLAELTALAEVETEGNVSQMIRKLVREALAARQARPRLLKGRQQ